MGRSLKWQFLLPLLMSLLFVLALLRTELRWRECTSDEGRVCFNYPLYLPYELRQQIDVHWMATLPAGILQLHPASMSLGYDRAPSLQWPRVLITVLSCATVWFLIGLWLQSLREARHLSDHGRLARYLILVLVVAFVPFSFFAVYLGMRGGYEGPTMTNAGLVMPLILAVLALVDLKLLPTALRVRTTRAGLALVLALLYLWADTSYQAQLKRHDDREAARREAKSTDPNVVSFSFPFAPEPETVEGLALHTPALLVAELPGLLLAKSSTTTPVWRMLKSAIIWTYWFLIFPLLGLQRPGATSVFRFLRPWLRGACAAFCTLACRGGSQPVPPTAQLLASVSWLAS